MSRGVVPSYSSIYPHPGYEATNPFTPSPPGRWNSNLDSPNGAWLGVDLGASYLISKFRVHQFFQAPYSYATSFKLQTADDAAFTTNVVDHHVYGPWSNADTGLVTLTTPATGRFWRVLGTGSSGTTNGWGIYTFELHGVPEGGEVALTAIQYVGHYTDDVDTTDAGDGRLTRIVTAPSGLADGDLLLAYWGAGNADQRINEDGAMPAGWTAITPLGQLPYHLYWKIWHTGDPTTYQFKNYTGGSPLSGVSSIVAYRNVDADNPIADWAETQYQVTASPTTPAFDPDDWSSSDGAMLVFFHMATANRTRNLSTAPLDTTTRVNFLDTSDGNVCVFERPWEYRENVPVHTAVFDASRECHAAVVVLAPEEAFVEVDGEADLIVSATMTVDPVVARYGAVDFAITSAFEASLYRAIYGDVAPMTISADLAIGDYYAARTGIAIMVVTAELDPIQDAYVVYGATANLDISVTMPMVLGSIPYYGAANMVASVAMNAIGGIQWEAASDMSVAAQMEADSQMGTVGYVDPWAVDVGMTADGNMIIGGLTDDGWRVSVNMFAAADNIAAGFLSPGSVNARFEPIEAASILRFEAAPMAVTARLVAEAQGTNNAVVEMEISAEMEADAFAMIGSGPLVFPVTVDLEVSDENFYTIRTAQVATVRTNASGDVSVTPGLFVDTYIDVELDGLLIGRPLPLRVSATMRVRAAIAGDVITREGAVTFALGSGVSFRGVVQSFGGVTFDIGSAILLDPQVRVIGGVTFDIHSSLSAEYSVQVTKQFITLDPITSDVIVNDFELVPEVITVWMEGIKAAVIISRPTAVGGTMSGLNIVGSVRLGKTRVVGSSDLGSA